MNTLAARFAHQPLSATILSASAHAANSFVVLHLPRQQP
jgi:hypothetical protein